MPAPDLLLYCTELVTTLNTARDWHLSARQREHYARALTAFVTHEMSPGIAQQIALNYHQDHRLVAALRNSQHPDHTKRWGRWMQQVRTILYHERLHWSADPAVDDEDFVQIALVALQRALPTYSYRSQFHVWVYSVVVRAIKRSIRDSRRLRRKAVTLSLEQLTTFDPDRAPHADDRAEDETYTRAVYQQIQQILAAQPDRRLRYIIHLAYVEDCHLNDIGERLQLSPARVRSLIRQVRRIISADPSIHTWLHTVDYCEFGCCAERAHG